LKQHKKIEYVK